MLPEQFDQHLGHVRELFTNLGEDPDRDGLKSTPKRYLNALQFLTNGYSQDVKLALNDAMFEVDYHDLVIVRDIEIYSLCEHHVLPFYGRCHVGYVPSGKVIGLSKLPRIVEIFARRLQVQERLTHEIADAVEELIRPQGVGVVVEAYHLCMMMRGVQKQNSFTLTSSMRGIFNRIETRSEFLSLIRAPRP